MSVARLQLILDSQQMQAGARQTADALGRVTAEGKRAETAVRGMSEAQQRAVEQARAQAAAQRAQAAAIAQSTAAAEAQAATVGKITAAVRLLSSVTGVGLTATLTAAVAYGVSQFKKLQDAAEETAKRTQKLVDDIAKAVDNAGVAGMTNRLEQLSRGTYNAKTGRFEGGLAESDRRVAELRERQRTTVDPFNMLGRQISAEIEKTKAQREEWDMLKRAILDTTAVGLSATNGALQSIRVTAEAARAAAAALTGPFRAVPMRDGQGNPIVSTSSAGPMQAVAEAIARQARDAQTRGLTAGQLALSQSPGVAGIRPVRGDDGTVELDIRERVERITEAQRRARQAAEQIQENLTRGMQSAVATLAEGLMTDGLRSARSFAQQLGAFTRRALAEAIAATITQRLFGNLFARLGGMIGGAVTGGGGDGTTPTANGGTTPPVAGGGMSMSAAAVAGSVLSIVSAFGVSQGYRARARDLSGGFNSMSRDTQLRLLRNQGRDSDAAAMERANENKQRLEAIEAQRQAELANARKRTNLFDLTPAAGKKREREINERFEQLRRQELEAQQLGDRLGGSIGDYNAPGSVNVAAMIGEIRRAMGGNGPSVPAGGVGGGRDGLTIVINGPVTTEAKSAGEFVRELQSMAQAQYGSPAEWSRVSAGAF